MSDYKETEMNTDTLSTLDVETVLVSPKLATAWLADKAHNRNVRAMYVDALADDMQSGDWRWNGATIKFDVSGRLIDGQHRLEAVVKSGETVAFLVVRGLDESAQESVDTGRSRTFGDTLRLRGEANYNTLAALLRRICGWGQYGTYKPYTPTSNARLSAVLDRYPEARIATTQGCRIADGTILGGADAAFLCWLFYNVDVGDADFFFARLLDGQNLDGDDPIYVLRRSLDKIATTRRSGDRPSAAYQVAITIKAWNAWRRGEQVKQLKFRPGGAKPESFPVPV